MSIGGAPDRPQCIATGTTGTWSGATGSSRGDWEPWAVDLAPYAGRLVEISLAYMSGHRPSRGVLIDDVALPSGEVATFEDGLGSWQVAGPPDGHGPNSVDFGLVRAEELPPNPNAAIVVTPQSVWLGFDLSSLATDGERAVLMRRTLDYFLPTYTAFLPSVRYD
jgi:hypothetical protein